MKKGKAELLSEKPSGVLADEVLPRAQRIEKEGVEDKKDMFESLKRVRASSMESFSAAGAINSQWKGADTDKGMVRLAPSWRALEQASSTATASPAMTVWAGEL